MFCKKCGADNPESAVTCYACGEPLASIEQPRQPMEPKPDNYLVWSILATLFCCLIPGIVAIVYAAQVDTKWMMGDYAGAREAAKTARTWTLVAFILGLAGIIAYIIIFAIYAVFIAAAMRGID